MAGGSLSEGAAAEPLDLTPLLALATGLAQAASALLLDRLGHARSSITTKSSATDMVTEMDRAAEKLIAGGHPRRETRRRHRR